MMNHVERIAKELLLKPAQVEAVVELLADGNTIPFIARYRKERTGTLDEEQIRQVEKLLERLRTLDDRRETIISAIETQEKMTPELKKRLLEADSLTILEDLYQPYKLKRKTRAVLAREKGLQGLADLILKQKPTKLNLDQMVEPYLNDEVPDLVTALAGARDIVAEIINDHADVRQATREKAFSWGVLKSEKIASADDPREVYRVYYEFECKVDRLRPHQVLAINRGEAEKVLRVKIEVSERDWRWAIERHFKSDRRSLWFDQLNLAVEDAAQRLLLPAIERDIRRMLTEKADLHAIGVFSDNLKALLTQPPMNGYVVLGIDPAYRTGCKIAIVDATGKLLDTTTIYPHSPQKKWIESKSTIKDLIRQYGVNLVTIGNGTASRETEMLVAEIIKEVKGVYYLITNEAGASVYSASPLAREEFPQLDVSLRGAVSIARRVQDPLAELVKIDPKAIGVGMYQHDVNQKELSAALTGVVESVVNQVGVDVNTASPALLANISGVGPKLAERIVAHRNVNGQFTNRKQILNVSGLGAKAFEQSAGFMRIRDGENPLDNSAIHPESYAIAEKVLKRTGLKITDDIMEKKLKLETLKRQASLRELAQDLGTGEPTLVDIFDQLVQPGRDPREDLPVPILRSDVLSMEDLVPGMRLKGTVRNVVDFGAFIDIGVKQDGLLHRSQIPREIQISVGDIINVEVESVQIERSRIGLKLVA